MDIKSAAQVIRDTVSTEEIVGMYGYKIRRGFMVCPFHGDRDASLKVYPGTGGWHCFGCGKGGSVIDFVMEQENCDFRTAVLAIDKAAGLHLQDPNENPYSVENDRRLQKWLDDYVEAAYAYMDAVRATVEQEQKANLERMKRCETLRLMDPPALTAEDYDFMNQWREICLYNEYRMDRIDELREEVAAWRRKARRVKSAS